MEWIEILCQDEETGVEYRRLIRRMSIRQVVEYPENDEVLIVLEPKKTLFGKRTRYLVTKESFEDVQKKLLSLREQRQ